MMQFLFRPDDRTRPDEHFAANCVEDAQTHAAKVFKDQPGTVWRIDYVMTTRREATDGYGEPVNPEYETDPLNPPKVH